MLEDAEEAERLAEDASERPHPGSRPSRAAPVDQEQTVSESPVDREFTPG